GDVEAGDRVRQAGGGLAPVAEDVVGNRVVPPPALHVHPGRRLRQEQPRRLEVLGDLDLGPDLGTGDGVGEAVGLDEVRYVRQARLPGGPPLLAVEVVEGGRLEVLLAGRRASGPHPQERAVGGERQVLLEGHHRVDRGDRAAAVALAVAGAAADSADEAVGQVRQQGRYDDREPERGRRDAPAHGGQRA